MMNVKMAVEWINDNREITIYDISTKYITLKDWGTKEYIINKYGNCWCIDSDIHENGIDLFIAF